VHPPPLRYLDRNRNPVPFVFFVLPAPNEAQLLITGDFVAFVDIVEVEITLAFRLRCATWHLVYSFYRPVPGEALAGSFFGVMGLLDRLCPVVQSAPGNDGLL
jgi:hypothetical protein